MVLKHFIRPRAHPLSSPAYSATLALSFLTKQWRRSIHVRARPSNNAIVDDVHQLGVAFVHQQPVRQHRQLLVPYGASVPKSRRSYSDLSSRRTTTIVSTPAPYTPPGAGLISRLPPPWIPYAELIRLDKPTGTYYLFLPCLFSTLLAAPLATPITPPLSVVGTTLLFLSGALIMRGAGCTINDLWDRNLDPHVTRTRLRPLARGAVTPQAAVVFTGFQLLAGLGVLLQFPTSCLYYGIPSLLFVTAYPLAKRVTYYPQFVLGLTFSWGAIMGFPALGIDLLSSTPALMAATCLYASNVAWTVLYDMIYAHMDIRDDVKAGIKSIVLRHEANTKNIMTGLAAVQVALLAAGRRSGRSRACFLCW